MAKVTKLVDDIDGSDAEMTLTFGLDGVEYEVDLNDEHYAKHYEALTFLASVARVVERAPVKPKRTLSTGKKTSVTGKTQEMREWLRANGHNVSDRGRVPTHLVDLYETRTRGPVAVVGDEKKEEGGENGTAGEPTQQDEDKVVEQAVIERVKTVSKPRARRTAAQKKTPESDKPFTGLRKALSLVDGE